MCHIVYYRTMHHSLLNKPEQKHLTAIYLIILFTRVVKRITLFERHQFDSMIHLLHRIVFPLTFHIAVQLFHSFPHLCNRLLFWRMHTHSCPNTDQRVKITLYVGLRSDTAVARVGIQIHFRFLLLAASCHQHCNQCNK